VDAVSISLDSAREELHDQVRGKGTHAKVIRAIEMLRDAGMKWIHINAVITPVTKDHVEEFLEYAWDDVGANHVSLAGEAIAVEDPSGRWGAEQYMMTEEEYLHMSKQEKNFYAKRSRNEEPQTVHRFQLRRTQCGVGNGIVSVDANGDVYPCQTMHTEEMLCGNAFEDGLEHVLEHSAKLNEMKNLVVDILPECSTCPVRYVCAGGCRQEAYSREGDLLARNRAMCPTFFENAVNKLWNAANQPAEKMNEAPKQFTPIESCVV
jgi:radical SAM protein with 4Fe4S-binding SPASM domain